MIVWTVAARGSLPALLPGPDRVAVAFVQLLLDIVFWRDILAPSLIRALLGLTLAVCLGGFLGYCSFKSTSFAALIAPTRVILMGMPAPILVILGILWFEGDLITVVSCVGVLLLPVFQIAVAQGLSAVDSQLDEMAWVFQVWGWRRVRHIVWPALWIALGPALRIGVANGLRVTLLTELLSGADGLGNAVLTAQSYLLTDRLFALVIVILVLIAGAEWLLSRLTRAGSRS